MNLWTKVPMSLWNIFYELNLAYTVFSIWCLVSKFKVFHSLLYTVIIWWVVLFCWHSWISKSRPSGILWALSRWLNEIGRECANGKRAKSEIIVALLRHLIKILCNNLRFGGSSMEFSFALSRENVIESIPSRIIYIRCLVLLLPLEKHLKCSIYRRLISMHIHSYLTKIINSNLMLFCSFSLSLSHTHSLSTFLTCSVSFDFHALLTPFDY